MNFGASVILIRVVLGLAICALLRAAVAQSVTNYYVATNGLHTNNFTTWENAATNLRDVLALARDGDRITLSN